MNVDLNILLTIDNKAVQEWVLDVAAAIENSPKHQGQKATQAWRRFQDLSSEDKFEESTLDHLRVMNFFKYILNNND